jgi:hypothetical protein
MKKIENNGNGFGVASLVVSIFGFIFLLMPYFGIVLSVLGIVFGYVQKRKFSNGVATAGLILGIIGTVINAIVLFVVLIILFAALGAA